MLTVLTSYRDCTCKLISMHIFTLYFWYIIRNNAFRISWWGQLGEVSMHITLSWVMSSWSWHLLCQVIYKHRSLSPLSWGVIGNKLFKKSAETDSLLSWVWDLVRSSFDISLGFHKPRCESKGTAALAIKKMEWCLHKGMGFYIYFDLIFILGYR